MKEKDVARRGLASHAFTRKGLAQTNPNGKHAWPKTAMIILIGLGLSRNYQDAIVPDSLGSGPAGEWIVGSTGTRTIHGEWTSPGLCWTINYFTTEGNTPDPTSLPIRGEGNSPSLMPMPYSKCTLHKDYRQ